MCCEDDSLNKKLAKKLLDCEEDIEERDNYLDIWLNSLEELSEIEDAFKTNGKAEMCGKAILDVGTDAVKPLYIALKLKPAKIIGINDDELPSFASDIEQKAKLVLPETRIRFYNCSLFDSEALDRILKREKIAKFDFILISKTLHHLRTKECVINERDNKHKEDEKHQCREDEKCCIYGFDAKEVFDRLLELGKRVIVYEAFYPQDEDDDKVKGRGGYFTAKEWRGTLRHLSDKYAVEFISPEQFSLNEETFSRIESILRKVDCVCFYVEE
jgi:SAM-dependent methyltransferase